MNESIKMTEEDIAAWRQKGFPDDLLVACLETAAPAGASYDLDALDRFWDEVPRLD